MSMKSFVTQKEQFMADKPETDMERFKAMLYKAGVKYHVTQATNVVIPGDRVSGIDEITFIFHINGNLKDVERPEYGC